jgi:flagellar basal-body rod modification protein FlgD
MTTVDPLSALAAQTSTKSKEPTQLGQNEFLKLMLAQLKNQDPMKPMDPSEFLGQLAQFSTVTGIESMNGSLTGLSESLRSAQLLSGANLVGRDILAASTTATIAAGGSVHAAAEVPEDVTGLQVTVRDSSGQIVRTFPVEPREGLVEFTWDGKTATGEPVAAGTYEFEVVASWGGENYELTPLMSSRVNSVTMDSATNELTLNTNIGALALSDVRRVM